MLKLYNISLKEYIYFFFTPVMNSKCNENNCFRCDKIKKRFSLLSLSYCKCKKNLKPHKTSNKKLRRSQRILQQSKKCQGILRRSHRIGYQPIRFHEEFNY
jgi:hypothetical protein